MDVHSELPGVIAVFFSVRRPAQPLEPEAPVVRPLRDIARGPFFRYHLDHYSPVEPRVRALKYSRMAGSL